MSSEAISSMSSYITMETSSQSTNSSLMSGNITMGDSNSTNSTGDAVACQLLGDFGYIIQGILGFLCFAVLVCKINIYQVALR